MIAYRRLKLEDKAACLPSILDLVEEERQRADSLINLGPPTFYEKFFSPFGTAFGAFESESLRGFALLGFSSHASAFWRPYVEALGVEKDACGILFSTILTGSHRRIGIGSKLHRFRESHARKLGIRHFLAMVHPDNAGSRRLLKKRAFSTLARLNEYESAGPRLVMYRSFEPSPTRPPKASAAVNAAPRALHIGY